MKKSILNIVKFFSILSLFSLMSCETKFGDEPDTDGNDFLEKFILPEDIYYDRDVRSSDEKAIKEIFDEKTIMALINQEIDFNNMINGISNSDSRDMSKKEFGKLLEDIEEKNSDFETELVTENKASYEINKEPGEVVIDGACYWTDINKFKIVASGKRTSTIDNPDIQVLKFNNDSSFDYLTYQNFDATKVYSGVYKNAKVTTEKVKKTATEITYKDNKKTSKKVSENCDYNYIGVMGFVVNIGEDRVAGKISIKVDVQSENSYDHTDFEISEESIKNENLKYSGMIKMDVYGMGIYKRFSLMQEKDSEKLKEYLTTTKIEE